MNHAFLIIAHNQPEHLHRLVKRLDAPNHFFFIHIDKKHRDLLTHPALIALSSQSNISVSDCISVNWGGVIK